MENFPDTQNKDQEKKEKNNSEIQDKKEIVLGNININGVIKEKKLKAILHPWRVADLSDLITVLVPNSHVWSWGQFSHHEIPGHQVGIL